MFVSFVTIDVSLTLHFNEFFLYLARTLVVNYNYLSYDFDLTNNFNCR